MRSLNFSRPRLPGNKAENGDGTKISIDFKEHAPELRRLAAENDISVSALMYGMVALWLAPESTEDVGAMRRAAADLVRGEAP